MFALFDENPAMTLQDIKETKRYGQTDRQTHGQHENSKHTTNKVCRGINYINMMNLAKATPELAVSCLSMRFMGQKKKNKINSPCFCRTKQILPVNSMRCL